MSQQELYKIVIGLSSFLVGGGFLFGYFIIRFIRGGDDKIKDLYTKTNDLPAIREPIKWLKNK